MRGDHGIDGALRDGVAGQHAVIFGIAPGALATGLALLADGVVLDASATIDHDVDQEVALALVVDDGLVARIVCRGVADIGLAEAEVLMEIQPNLAGGGLRLVMSI